MGASKALDTIFVGKAKIVYQRTTHSTQNLAILLAEKNPDSDGIVIIAEQQKERTWQGKPGSGYLPKEVYGYRSS